MSDPSDIVVIDAGTGAVVPADAAALAVPVQITIPDDVDDAGAMFGQLSEFVSKGQWGVAAGVWAYVDLPGKGVNRQGKKVTLPSYKLTCDEFAAKGYHGLKSPKTIRNYWRAWQQAIDDGLAEPTAPGKTAELPGPAFKWAPKDPGDADEVETPPGQYGVIYLDPPWQYDFAETTNRDIENHYPTMTTEVMKGLKIPAEDDCVMYMWATAPKLSEAFELLDAWGFTYKTNMVWVKDKIGMGYWARGRHELLLIATKGTPKVPDAEDRPDSVIEAPRTRHSAKPEEAYRIIEIAHPGATKIEMFARITRDGWESWGNQL